MKKLLLLLLLVAANTVLKAQINETFEAGTTPLGWVAADKAKYLGVVNNPDTNKVSINKSAKCAGFVKDSTTAYSYAYAKFATPLNLKGNSKFKIQLFSKANRPTKFIFKFEGGATKEILKIVGSNNRWEELTFDEKSVDTVTRFTQLTIFFDATNATSKDTFYFDNLVQLPDDACSGVTPPKTQNLYDDFECIRVGGITNNSGAPDSLTVVDNPDKSGINTSVKVGRYADVAGPGSEYAAIVYDNIDPIDLTKFPYLHVKVRAPKAGNFLLKLEGGTAVKEVPFIITADQTNKWIDAVGDFSSAAASGNTRLVLFLNAGQPGAVGDIYYLDDIRFTTVPPLEDFEPQKITWTPLNNDATLHGSFAVVANPAPTSAVNSSAYVGKYTKGSATISVLTGALVGFVATAAAPQLNLQVNTSDSGKVVRIQLVSATVGIIEASATTSTKNDWESLAFTLPNNAIGVTDISKINILFDPSTSAAGKVYYFDNLALSKSTVNACLTVVANPNIIDDFECQRNYTIDVPGPIRAIPNPKQGPLNPSDKVGEYTDPFDQYSALTYIFPKVIDLSKYNQFSIKIWAPKVVPLLFKLEGSVKGLTKEFPSTVTKSGDWVTYTTDFSGEKGKDYTKISIFFNIGITPTTTDIYYVDDIQLKSEPINGCLTTFESLPLPFIYFGTNDATKESTALTVVANPKKTGIDTSANVLKFTRFKNSLAFQGAFADLPAILKWTNPKITVRAKVYMDHIGNLGLKLEPGLAGSGNGHELPIANTKVNDWEEITADFTTLVAAGEVFSRLTFFFDLNLPVNIASDVTSYIDDIVIGDGAGCVATKVGTNDVAIAQFGFAPNPAQNEIYVRNLLNVRRLDVTNVWGQIVRSISFTNNSFDIQTIPLEGLSAGMYIVSGYDDKGMIANGKFIKE